MVAHDLLGQVLTTGRGGDRVAVRLTETEAYHGATDPASHAFRGRTARNAVMFGPAGHLYLYFVYGMHWCANVVTGVPGEASAVLLRAGEVIDGLEPARARRPAARIGPLLASGPARLAAVLGWGTTDTARAVNGVDICGRSGEPTRPSGADVGGYPAAGSRYLVRPPRRRRSSHRRTVAVLDHRRSDREHLPSACSRAAADTGSLRQDEAVTSQLPPPTTATPEPGPSPEFDSVFDELTWRGLVHQTTGEEALRAALNGGPITFYVGFDPTAPSLHIGNLVQLLTARRIQNAGHHPLGLVGGSTGLIGDPKMSGERVLNTPETVAGWVDKIRVQVEKYLDFAGDHPARIVNNLDWTAPMSAIEFLRDVGKHFRMGRMLSKDTVATRLASDEGLSFTEFSYQILQGMDFLELFRRYGCVLQTGGSDQWGNLISGTDLIHKVEAADRPCAVHPADHQGRRHQIRQDRGRHSVARQRTDQPLCLLPVLDQQRRP